MSAFGWPFAGACAVSVMAYGVTFVQIRRRFPERLRFYIGEFALAAAGFVAAGFARGINPTLLAASPAMVFALGLVASKGDIGYLIKDDRFDDEENAEVERARRRFGVMGLSAIGVVVLVAFLS